MFKAHLDDPSDADPRGNQCNYALPISGFSLTSNERSAGLRRRASRAGRGPERSTPMNSLACYGIVGFSAITLLPITYYPDVEDTPHCQELNQGCFGEPKQGSHRCEEREGKPHERHG